MISRRCLLAGLASMAGESQFLAQCYVWTQEMHARKVPLAAGVDEILTSTRKAGFTQVELMAEFFSEDNRTATLRALKKNSMTSPIVYFGEPMPPDLPSVVRDAGTVALNHNPSPKPQKALKTDGELASQAERLNRLDKEIRAKGLRFFVHHHDPEMLEGAREWRHILEHTSCELCIDTDWAFRGGQDPVAILQKAGQRVASLHLRSSRQRIWSESFGDGDIDYRLVAAEVRKQKVRPFLVVELAYEAKTVRTRTLEDDLRLSREYAGSVFQ